MPNVNLLPNANGSVQQWDFYPMLLYAWDKVADPVGSPDDDSTYVHTNVNNEIEDFNHVTSDLLIGATITNVRVTARCKQVAGSFPPDSVNIGVKVAGTRYGAAANTELSTSYVDYVKDWTDNPADSEAWEKSDIDDLQSSLKSIDSNEVTRCTQIYLTVTYTPAVPANPLIGKPLISPDIINKSIIR